MQHDTRLPTRHEMTVIMGDFPRPSMWRRMVRWARTQKRVDRWLFWAAVWLMVVATVEIVAFSLLVTR